MNRLDPLTHLHLVTLAEVVSPAVNSTNPRLDSSSRSLTLRTRRSKASRAKNVALLNQEAGKRLVKHRMKRKEARKDRNPAGLHESLQPSPKTPIVKRLMSSKGGNLAAVVKKKEMRRRLRRSSQVQEILNRSPPVVTPINNPKKTRSVNSEPARKKLYPGRGVDRRRRSQSPSQRSPNLSLKRSS